MLDIGLENPGSVEDYYNVVENCEFLKSGHHSLKPLGKYTVARNNYAHNEAWYSYNGSDRSYRIAEAIAATGQGYGLFEGNRVGHNDLDYGDDGNSAIKYGLSYGIVRYNSFFDVTWYGFYVIPQAGDTNNNYFYNNTFFSFTGKGVRVHAGGTGNVFKNNLHWDTGGTNNNLRDYSIHSPNNDWDTFIANNTVDSNFNDYVGVESVSDPLFVDETLTNYSSWTLPDLNLQENSPAKDQGTHLTQANGSGSNSDTLIVDDARYFQDGKFGSASGCDPSKWPSNVDIQADWIAIGTVSNTIQISSINYDTNTITLASPMTWGDKAKIWLYKKSDGKIVLKGYAPDAGAYERNMPSSPKNLRIVEN